MFNSGYCSKLVRIVVLLATTIIPWTAYAQQGLPTGFDLTINPTTQNPPILAAGSNVTGYAVAKNDVGTITHYPNGDPIILKVVIDSIHKTTVTSGDPNGFTLPTSTYPQLLGGTYNVTVSENKNPIGETLTSGTSKAIILTGVELEIYNTPAPGDDLVRLSKTVTARAKVSGNPANDVTVFLTNPDGRLRFAGATTQQLILPQNGAWVPLSVTGHAGSAGANDAKIEVHSNTVTGPLLGVRPLSVWQFTNGSITATPAYDYMVLNDEYFYPFKIEGGKATSRAITVAAKVTLLPSGLDTSAPQLASLKLVIQQNLMGGGTMDVYYGSPRIREWRYAIANPAYAAVSGQFYPIPQGAKLAAVFPQDPTNDSGEEPETAFPWYNYRNAPNPDVQQPPSPIINGDTTNQITDNPGTDGGYTTGVVTAGGKTICIVTFDKITRGAINFAFNDWAVIAEYNAAGAVVGTETLAKTNWAINVDTDGAGNKKATGGTSAPATTRGVDLPISTGSETRDPSFIGATVPTQAP